MPPRRELSAQLRSQICELHSYGISYRRIHNIHREILLGTIKTTCLRERKRENNLSYSRSGRPRVISASQRDEIYDIIIYKNPYINNAELAYDILGDASKKHAIRALYKEMNRRKWR